MPRGKPPLIHHSLLPEGLIDLWDGLLAYSVLQICELALQLKFQKQRRIATSLCHVQASSSLASTTSSNQGGGNAIGGGSKDPEPPKKEGAEGVFCLEASRNIGSESRSLTRGPTLSSDWYKVIYHL